jgi:uncharacterized protein (TIGR00730 family)
MIIREFFRYLFYLPRYMYCLWYISQLNKPIITIFGGKRTKSDSKYYELAYELAGKLVKSGLSILTGGGPGVMEAAIRGSIAQNKMERCLGIEVIGLDSSHVAECKQKTIYASDFAERKKLLINYSDGFVAFPGGLGTIDEITEVLNLIKTYKIKKKPVILIGTEYWNSFSAWVHLAEEQDYIAPEHKGLIKITDDINSAVHQIIAYIAKENEK